MKSFRDNGVRFMGFHWMFTINTPTYPNSGDRLTALDESERQWEDLRKAGVGVGMNINTF